MKPWVTVGMLAASVAHGETLYQRDGIALEGTVRIEVQGAGVCQVSADQHPAEVYERMKANHGQPLHVWRLAFAVRNGSGRRIERLTAHFGIASEAPPCTSWSGPLGNYVKPVRWANSFQVLQKPDGMGLGEEVNDTIFVLAFHDQQPKFESWNVDYRFVDEAGKEAEPAQGSPAFIVVPIPSHATVSLLNAAQPYRRRMPLEPGRYEVEVSASGYRTHRAWVEHKQTWPHRIELERLPEGDGRSTLSVPAGRLSPRIQMDLNLRKAEQALQDGDAAKAREAMERLASLQQEHGLEPEAEDHFLYAQAWEAAGEPERAMEAVVRYLQLQGQRAKHYTEALDLMSRAESAQKGLASGVSEASRFGPEASTGGNSQPTDGPDPVVSGARQGEPVRALPAETMAVRDPRIEEQAARVQDPECGWWTSGFIEEVKAAWRKATVESITACLDGGVDLQAQDFQNHTPLHRAAEFNEDPAVVELLLARGADVTAMDGISHAPVHKAGANNTPAVLRVLLEAGAAVNARGADAATPLHWAAWKNERPAVIELLLMLGADLEAQDDRGLTPLHRAAYANENLAVLEVLLEHGADVNTPSKSGVAPVQNAAWLNKNPAILGTLLASGADPAIKLKDGRTLLHLAAQNNQNPEVLRVLIEGGAEVNARDNSSNQLMPLHLAAFSNENPAVVGTLLASGADPAIKLKNGRTLLHLAAQNNQNPEVVRVLIEGGAEVNARDNSSQLTPLHLAAESNENPAVVGALLAAGADVAAAAKYGLTALHAAAANNENLEITELLIAAGADSNAYMEDGDTPLHLAAESNENPAVVEALLKGGAMLSDKRVGIAWHSAVSNKNLAVLEKLMAAVREAGTDPVAVRGRFGTTALHRAAFVGNPAATEFLLERGADPRARDLRGSTPLHEAAETGLGEYKAVIALLVESGADVNARDEDGDTPLHIAAADYEGDVSEALLAVGADVNAVDREGNTPLHRAAKQLSWFPSSALRKAKGGDSDAIEALLTGGANARSRNATRETPWDILQASEDPELKKADGYWQLNDAQFNTRQVDSQPRATVASSRVAARGSGQGHGPDCTRQRLIGLGVLTSQLPGAVPSTIQFTDSRMVIVSRPAAGAELRQESEYEVSADAITYRLVRAIGTIPGSGTRAQPIRNPGPHTEACSLAGRVLSFGDGTWR